MALIPNNNLTLNQISVMFEDISNRHLQLNDYGFGLPSDIGQTRKMNYPYLWVSVAPGTSIVQSNQGSAFSYEDLKLVLIVADKLNDNNSEELGEESNNGLEVSSDTKQILNDIITELSTHPYYRSNGVSISDVTMDPTWDADDGVVNGWVGNLTFRMPWRLTYCNTPFSGSTPLSSIGVAAPSGPVGLTCDTLSDCSTFSDLQDQVDNIESIMLSDNRLVSGGASFYSGLSYEITPLTYIINGTFYSTSTIQYVTSISGDTSFDRIDVIVVDILGVTSIVEGTPSSNPVQPDIDEGTQVLVALITIPDGATSITPSETIVYSNNSGTDWTGTTNSATIDLNYTGITYLGSSKSIKYTLTPNTYWSFFNYGGSFDTTTQNTIQFRVYNTVAWTSAQRLNLKLYSSSTIQIGTTVQLYNSKFGFNSNLLNTWQTVSIPISAFSLSTALIGKLLFQTSITSGVGMTFILDDIRMVEGPVVPSPTSNWWNVKGDTAAVVYPTGVNSQLIISGGTNINTFASGTNKLNVELDQNIVVNSISAKTYYIDSNHQEIQINSGGTLKGDSSFVYDFATDSITLGSRSGTYGTNSSVFGYSVQATGNFASAFGRTTRADGEGAFATGRDTIASGVYSFATGEQSTASGNESFSSGYRSTASGHYSSAFGYRSTASGKYSGSFGYRTEAQSPYSFAFGNQSLARADGAFATGKQTNAAGNNSTASGYKSEAQATNSVAFGNNSTASGVESFSQGKQTTASGKYSSASGYKTNATQYAAHSEGTVTNATGEHSHAEGYTTIASHSASHAEGYNTTSSGHYGSHSEGRLTTASGYYSHAEGKSTIASARGSHAEGYNTTASGTYGSHAGGRYSIASGKASFNHSYRDNNTTNVSGATGNYSAILGGQDQSATGNYSMVLGGKNNVASGNYSTSSGYHTTASNYYSHSSGKYTTASGAYSTASGYISTASAQYSTASGNYSTASGQFSNASGSYSTASGYFSRAEGKGTTASGKYSIASGFNSKAYGIYSRAYGSNNISSGSSSTASGYGTTAKGNYSSSSGYATKAYGIASFNHSYITDSHNYNFSGATGDYSAILGGVDQSVIGGASAILGGKGNIVSGTYSAILGGVENLVTGEGSIVLGGKQNIASGVYSSASGDHSTASGNYGSHAEGNYTTASGNYGSHSEGNVTIASGKGSHAEGNITTASGHYSHAEGSQTTSSGNQSHSEGLNTKAIGHYSHAGGFGNNTTTYSLIASGLTSFNHSYRNNNTPNVSGATGNYSAILGGQDQSVTHTNSVVLGGSGLTSKAINTVYVPNLNIGTLSVGTSINNLGIDSSGKVIIGSSGSTVDLSQYYTSSQTNANFLSANTFETETISVSLNGLGNILTSGTTGYRVVESTSTIVGWYLIGDTTGTTTFDIKRSGVSIIGAGNAPTLTSQMRNNAAPASWTSTAITANDELEFVLGATTTLTKAYLYIQIQK